MLIFSGKIKEWRRILSCFYLSQKSNIRFGRRWFDTAGIDDLSVDLHLVEDVGTSPKDLKKDARKFFLSHDVRRSFGFMPKGHSLTGELFFYGNAEFETTEQITKCIAYQNLCKFNPIPP